MPQESPTAKTWIALLGRRDEVADGVEDYCNFLGEALARRGVELRQVRVQLMERGWLAAFMQLRRDSAIWRGKWLLLQYTALGWSRHGIPFGVLAVLAILRCRGALCAVVFHEPFGFSGPRLIDRVRGICQDWVVRVLCRLAHKSIFTVPLETLAWLPEDRTKGAFIPIGANIPQVSADRPVEPKGMQRTISVFCLSEMPNRQREVQDIAHCVRSIATNGTRLRVVFLGRGTGEARLEIETAFEKAPVEVVNLGLQSAADVSRSLADSDAMLCVRGELFARRGSAIAGVACGLPIVGYGDASQIFPLGEAGVYLVPNGDREALGAALGEVLHNPQLRDELREKSRRAQMRYFSWDVIAEKFCSALQDS